MSDAENATEINIKWVLKVAGLLLRISSQSKKETAINGCSPERVPEEIPALGIIPPTEEMIEGKDEERENEKAKEKERAKAKAREKAKAKEKAKEKAKAKAMVKQLNGELQRQAPEGSLLQEGTIALYVRSL